MEVTELRIGNLFNEKFTNTIIEVESISKNAITFSGDFKNDWQAETIPLTEEWLKKFGFNCAGGNYYLEHGSIEIGLMTSKRFYIQIRSENTTLDIKYVHQLQNLWQALTNKELTLCQ